MDNLKIYAIILASGSGKRFGSDLPKQFLKIGDKTLVEWSLEAFENSEFIDEIILVINSDYKDKFDKLVSGKYKKLSKMVKGGATRKDSSFNGVSAVDDVEAKVLIHDCARPFVSQGIIENCVKALDKYDAVGVGIDTTDTIVKTENDIIKSVPNRKTLKRIQTPQGFRLSLIKKAHSLAKSEDGFTDDCGLVVKYGLSDVYMANGSADNIKITYPDDVFYAGQILKNINK